MTLAEDHFRKRQLDLERMTGESLSGTRAPPPTATSDSSEDRRKISQLVSDNKKLSMTLEGVQSDLEKRVAMNVELNGEIQRLKEQMAKWGDAQKEVREKEQRTTEEIRVAEFRLKKARDEIVDLKVRMKEFVAGRQADSGFELKKENARLKKLIGEKIIPLIRKKDEVIAMYECMSRQTQGSEKLLAELDKLNN